LFTPLEEIQLNEEKDSICWKWTVNSEYSAASAYEAQFLSAYPRFCASMIWQARTKCRFFVWLAVQGKAPPTDNLAKNGSCDPNSVLCFCEPETNEHLLMECNFIEVVWDKVA
jgi:hypothetical protein